MPKTSFLSSHYVKNLLEVYAIDDIYDELIFLNKLNMEEFLLCRFFSLATLNTLLTTLGIQKLKSFLLTLRYNKRFDLLPSIVHDLLNKDTAVVYCVKDHLDNIKAHVYQQCPNTKIEFCDDPSVLDGFIIEKNHIIYDFSLKTYINLLLDGANF
jgi:F0F1-type ATP synthase delta subunit